VIITDSPLHAPFHHCWLSFPSYSYLLELTAWEYHLSGLTATITSRVWWPTLFTVFPCHKFPKQWLLSFLYTYFYSFIHNPDCAICFILWYTVCMPSVLLHCWLGVSKSIWPVKIEWWDVDVSVWCVCICLEWGADCLHMVQLMPLHPKTSSSLASFKSRLVSPFWYQLTHVVQEKWLLNGCSSSSSSSSSDGNGAINAKLCESAVKH